MKAQRLLSLTLPVAVIATLACGHSSGRTKRATPRRATPQADGGAPDAGAPDSGAIRTAGRAASSAAKVSDAADAGAGAPSAPPAAAAGNAPCVLSADCPSGQHCDLGECYQECNTTTACKSRQTCSPRGRCLAAGQPDSDPAPVVALAGTVRGDPSVVVLTDRDDKLHLHVVADSKDEVRYRVEVSAPYLSVGETRGTFKDDAVLELAVDGSGQTGHDLSGSVRVVTSLGDVVFSTPMKIGVTGSYQGTISYDGVAGGPAIGTAHVGLDLVEKNGDVSAEFAPARSLLFPATAKQPAVTGKGSFTYTEGLDVVLRQLLPAGFGGPDDLFGRDIGRYIRLKLTPGDRGALDGTFEETIGGLLAGPVMLTGHAHFEQRPCNGAPAGCDPVVEIGSDDVAPMPTADVSQEPSLSDVFVGWQPEPCTPNSSASDLNGLMGIAYQVDVAFHQPLLDQLSGTFAVGTSDPLGNLADACANELALTTRSGPLRCSQVAPLACMLATIDSAKLGRGAYDAVGALYAHMLDAPIFVAQNDIVRAVQTSFVHGPQAESDLLNHGRSTLHAPATWALHPRMLEALRNADPRAHKGGGEAPSSAAVRTLARLLLVRSTIDGEAARITAGSRVGAPATLLLDAQKKGVEALLEAAALYGISASWKAVPPEVGAAFVDVLTPMDAGFTSLLQGSEVFGVPDGVIPNAYEPGREPTNFEQLLTIALSAIQSATTDETTFTTEGRQFEDDDDHFQSELEQVRTAFENQVKSDCGESFDLDKADWSTCGASSDGTVGSKLVAIQEAAARLESAQSRVEDKGKAIEIEQDRIDSVVGVREGTIEFTDATGERLGAIDREKAQLDGMEKALQIASQASVWNGGAPLAEAIGEYALADAQGELEVKRQNAETMQDVRVQEDNLKVEQLQSAATVKGLLVDMAEARVEMQEEVIGVLAARVDAENALADAKRASHDRTTALDRIANSSLRDPTARLLQSRAALDAIRSRAAAQKTLIQAGRGLEYYLNHPIGDALGDAVLNAYSGAEEMRLYGCLKTIFDQSRIALPKTESYTTDVSVRKLLGIDGPRKDDVTGEMLTPGAQFRQVLLKNENLDGQGGVAVVLSTTLDPGNQLWSSNVCDDRIMQIEAQLVGDFLGDNEAEVYLDLQSGGVIRKCDGEGLMSWSTSGHAVIQAGVNTFGTAPPNDSLNGLAVASSKWELAIPGGAAAPANSDVDLTKLEDVVLRIHHQARPIPDNPQAIAFDCLGAIGGG